MMVSYSMPIDQPSYLCRALTWLSYVTWHTTIEAKYNSTINYLFTNYLLICVRAPCLSFSDWYFQSRYDEENPEAEDGKRQQRRSFTFPEETSSN